MDKAAILKERERLQGLLDQYESGKVTHYDEDHKGELNRDTTAEQCDNLKRRIGELDRKIGEDWRA